LKISKKDFIATSYHVQYSSSKPQRLKHK